MVSYIVKCLVSLYQHRISLKNKQKEGIERFQEAWMSVIHSTFHVIYGSVTKQLNLY